MARFRSESLRQDPPQPATAGDGRPWTGRLWDFTAQEAAAPIVPRGRDAGIIATAIAADGHWLAAAAEDGPETSREPGPRLDD